uniref:DUSP-like protein n=1 Tax=Fredericella sultana TaxID=349672 RepID=J9JF57_9BILA|nr:DUSP-like protein [Fredericella sultana]
MLQGCSRWSSGPYSLIEEGLYIGSIEAAMSTDFIISAGITHIVTISGSRNSFPDRCTYLNIPIADEAEANIKEHFPEINQFIGDAILAGGRVLVNSTVGISRAPTAVLAYLMQRHEWSLKKALKRVRQRRLIVNPNEGFLRQLEAYELELLYAWAARDEEDVTMSDQDTTEEDTESSTSEDVSDAGESPARP